MSAAATVAEAIRRLLPARSVSDLVLLRRGLRADVYRVDFRAAASALVKHFPRHSAHAVRELASCRQLRDSHDITAAVLAIDAPNRIVVSEYLADATDLFAALREREPEQILAQLADVIARLIVTTPGPARSDVTAGAEAAALARAWPRVVAWAAPLHVTAPVGFGAAFERLLAHHVEGMPRSLTQGDPAPGNVLFLPTGATLLTDFEYGANRAVLFDLAQWYVRCPLPAPWFELLAAALSRALCAARVYRCDDDFRIDLARQVSYAAVYMLTWLPIERTIDGDPGWVGDWSVRQALLSATARGARAAGATPELCAVADWFGALQRALVTAWPRSGDGELDWRALVGRTPR